MREITAAVLREPKNLSIESISLAPPEFDEVRVEIKAVGVCGTDVHQYLGEGSAEYPIVLGHEGAGIVREVGPGVTGLQPGDHVVLSVISHCGRCPNCEVGKPYHCVDDLRIAFGGILPDGTRRLSADGEPINHFFGQSSFASEAVVPAKTAIPIPASVPFGPAALLGCGASTGIGAIFNTAAVEPGSSVAIFGCGGVGMSALLAAKAIGSTPLIAVDVAEDRLKQAEALGIPHTINAKQEDPIEGIRKRTDDGAQYVFDCVGDTTVMEQAIAATGEGGHTIVVGGDHSGNPFRVQPRRDLLPGGKTISGCVAGSMRPAADFPRYATMVTESILQLDSLVSATYPLERIEEAFEATIAGEGIRHVITNT